MANKKLKRGELLFNEGDPSKSMYFIQRGSLRLFKKKGTAAIELGMIQSGEVVGEMGFLDGGARSATAEAISETDLIEITGDKMQEQLKVLPPWLIVLLKTVVNRLRAANTKIKQLETASTAITYGHDGPSKQYAFLTPYDTMKVLLALGSTLKDSGPADENGWIKIKLGQVQRFSQQILGVHLSKCTEVIEAMGRCEALRIERVSDPKGEKTEVYIKDIEFMDQLLNFINDENMKDHTKKILLSSQAVKVMGLIVKHMPRYTVGPEGLCQINMAEIIALEKAENGGKEPFLPDAFKELVRNKLATELSISDAKTALTSINAKDFQRMHRMQLIIKELELVNESKRRAA
jgi:CRP-like cAMP-binding protein